MVTCHDLIGGEISRDAADPQLPVVDRVEDAEELVGPDFVVVELFDGPLGVLASRVADETEAAVRARKVHHETQFVNFANLHHKVKHYIIQGGPSGRGTLFVDIKLIVPPQFKMQLLLKCQQKAVLD